jgi:hypothetical protein
MVKTSVSKTGNPGSSPGARAMPPADAEDIGTVMSNFDHAIDGELADKLKAGNFVGDYTAYDFFGYLWFVDDVYKCAVMRYHRHIETIENADLAEIMRECSERYGSD